jgi:hypothetical protein
MSNRHCIVSTSLDVDSQGAGIAEAQRKLVNRLRSQAYEVQERFEVAERTALFLEQMLNPDAGVTNAVEENYEAHGVAMLKYQLFQLLVIDICATVLDRDSRTSSIRAIRKRGRCHFALFVFGENRHRPLFCCIPEADLGNRNRTRGCRRQAIARA